MRRKRKKKLQCIVIESARESGEEVRIPSVVRLDALYGG